MSRVLAGAGYRVTVADAGGKGIALAREIRPDLLLLDVKLPDMMGFDVCRTLKRDAPTAGIPVVYLSASHVSSSDQVEGLDAGADAYLTHPVEPHVLVATLAALLRVRLAEARHRRLVEAGVVGVAEFTADGRFLDANAEVARMLGRTREELVGATSWIEITPEEWRAADARAVEELRQRRPVRPYEKELLRPDGTRVPVLIAAASLDGRPGAGIAAVIDLTDRKRAERERAEALARAEAAQRRMGLLLKVASALIAEPARAGEALQRVAEACVPELADWVVVDRVGGDGAIARAAVAARPEKAAAARLVSEYHPARGEGAVGRALARGEIQTWSAREGDGLEPPRDERHRDALRVLGAEVGLVVPMLVRGRVLGAISFVLDGPEARFAPLEQALAEEIAGRTALALENARLYDELARALSAREDVLAEVSHDLRNPLSAVLLGTRQLERALAGAPDAQRRIDTIRRGGERMWRLVEDLLDLARIQAGRFAVERRRQPAAPLVHDAVEAQLPLAREKDVQLVPAAEPGVEVECERERIQQVLANLPGNALKFSPPGTRVDVSVVARGEEAVFSVRDRGPGIPAEDAAHVFERYWRTPRSGHGAGLGLSIAKGIVEAHGGRIWVDTAPGAGSTFSFSLRRARS